MLYIVTQRVAVEVDSPKSAHDVAQAPLIEQMKRQSTRGEAIVSTEVLKIKKVKA